MLVLSFGMMKSGSTLAFELCKSVLAQRGFEQRRLPDEVVEEGHHINFVDRVSTERLERLLKEIASTEIIAVKTHVPFKPGESDFIEKKIAEGQMKVHVNVRDPREMCLSLIDAGTKARANEHKAFSEIATLEDAIKVVARQLANCARWGALKGAKFLHYNDVAFDTEKTVQDICEDFGFLSFSQDEMKLVIDRVTADAFTQKSKAVKDRYKDDLTLRQNDFILENLNGARSFIRRVCEQKDYGWFQRPSPTSEKGSVEAGAAHDLAVF